MKNFNSILILGLILSLNVYFSLQQSDNEPFVDSEELRKAKFIVRERKRLSLKEETQLCFNLCLECFDNINRVKKNYFLVIIIN